MQESDTDLTLHSPGFPAPPDNEIPRDGFIRQIASTFSGKSQCVLLEGGPLTGKTNVLAQFARWHRATAISYFLSGNPFTQQVTTFLYAIVSQLSVALDKNPPEETMQFDRLRDLANTLAYQLVTHTKRSNTRYFYVIDGLDWAVAEPAGRKILELLPLLVDAASPYFLASCRADVVSELPPRLTSQRIKALNFTEHESIRYFATTKLTQDFVLAAHNKAGGTVGYLEIIKRIAATSPSAPPDINDLPDELEGLVAQQWSKALQSVSPQVRQAVEYLAASPAPLPSGVVMALVPDLPTIESVTKTGLVELNASDKELRFTNDIVRHVAVSRLSDKLPTLKARLIAALEREGGGRSDLLSLLYRETGNYKGIASLVAPEKLVVASSDEVELARLRRHLSTACEMARQEGDTNSLLQHGFGASLLGYILESDVDEAEVAALLSTGRTEDALRRSYASTRASSRIRLLARSYAAIKSKGEHIPVDARGELAHLIERLKVDQIEKEYATQIAAELFPVFPDLATELLERVLREDERRGIIDVALTAAVLSGPLVRDDNLVASISDPDLAYVARAHSRWLSGLPLDRLMDELKTVRSSKAREYLLRKWCRSNPESPELASAIVSWLEGIISDTDLVLPLRSLRQVVELVASAELPDIQGLVRRLDVPRVMMLQSPIEELTRVHLALSEAMASVDMDDAKARFARAVELVRERAVDADSRLYCLARLLLSARRIRLDDADISQQLRAEFDATQEELLANSADHFAILRGTIATLVQVDPGEALALVNKINTYERRVAALPQLLFGVLRGPGCEDFAPMLELGMGLADAGDQDGVLARTLELLDDDPEPLCEDHAVLLLEKARKMADSARAARSLATLIGLAMDEAPSVARAAASAAMESWRKIDDLREKSDVGFELVERMASHDAPLASGLLKEVLDIKQLPSSPLAMGELGKALIVAIGLAIRAIDLDVVGKRPPSLMHLEELIANLPAPKMRLELLAELAAASYVLGYEPYGEELVRDRILPHLRELVGRVDCGDLLVSTAPVIHAFDPAEFEGLAKQLSPVEWDRAWNRIALWAVNRTLLTDRVDAEEVNGAAKHARFGVALDAAQKIRWDSALYDALHGIARIARASFPTSIDGMQALDIARRIEVIAEAGLPDKRNIQHEGYRLIALAAAHGLRCHVVSKAKHLGIGKPDLRKKWQTIALAAKSVPNVADSAFVTIGVADEMFAYDEEAAAGMLAHAGRLVAGLPSVLDRCDRLRMIADVWARSGEKTEARAALELATRFAEEIDPQDRRSLVSLLVGCAHKIDPGFAAELTSRLDSRLPGIPFQSAGMSLQIEKAVANPAQFSPGIETPVPTALVMSVAARRLLKDVVNGRGVMQSEAILHEWLLVAAGLHIATFRDVCHWAIETIRRSKASVDIFDRMVDMASLVRELADAVLPGPRAAVPDRLMRSYPGLAKRIHVFRNGERTKALQWLKEWLAMNAIAYVKLCDPYFGPSDVLALTTISPECKVLIATTDKYLDLSKDVSTLAGLFRREWKAATSGAMPVMQILVVPQSHEARFHDRVLVSTRAGLMLGQSFNGLGLADGNVQELDEADTSDLETKYVDPLLNQAGWLTARGATAVVFAVR